MCLEELTTDHLVSTASTTKMCSATSGYPGLSLPAVSVAHLPGRPRDSISRGPERVDIYGRLYSEQCHRRMERRRKDRAACRRQNCGPKTDIDFTLRSRAAGALCLLVCSPSRKTWNRDILLILGTSRECFGRFP